MSAVESGALASSALRGNYRSFPLGMFSASSKSSCLFRGPLISSNVRVAAVELADCENVHSTLQTYVSAIGSA